MGQIGQAVTLLENGDAASAARLCRALLAADPRCGAAQVLLACALLALGADWPGALAAADAALELVPSAAPAHFVRGTALHALGRAADAVAALRAAIALAPEDAGAWLNLGNALASLDRLEAAEAALRRACALAPDAAAHASLGTVLVQRLRLPEAIDAYRAALRLNPDFGPARWDLGFAELLAGDFAAGWADMRARKPEENAALAARGVRGAEWDGMAPAGRTLLVCSAQGLGDAIQFARYLPLLAGRGARVLLACDARLAPLLRRMAGVAAVVAPGEPLPPHDAWVALSSLPRLFATDAGSVPAAAAYLAADPAAVAAWRALLPAGRPGVGLVWAGNPAHANDPRRSMPQAALAPLLAVSGIAWVSLQQGGAAPPGVVDWAPRLTDFSASAAAVAALDLVITVDTATAHLAGALGRPAWVALPWAPDWRWQLGRVDSPWYASLRLFRQPRPGDWNGVAEALATALSGCVSPSPSASRP